MPPLYIWVLEGHWWDVVCYFVVLRGSLRFVSLFLYFFSSGSVNFHCFTVTLLIFAPLFGDFTLFLFNFWWVWCFPSWFCCDHSEIGWLLGTDDFGLHCCRFVGLFSVSDRGLCAECYRSRERKMKSREVSVLVLCLIVLFLGAVSNFCSSFVKFLLHVIILFVGLWFLFSFRLNVFLDSCRLLSLPHVLLI